MILIRRPAGNVGVAALLAFGIATAAPTSAAVPVSVETVVSVLPGGPSSTVDDVLIERTAGATTRIELLSGVTGRLLFARGVVANHRVEMVHGGHARVLLTELGESDQPLADGSRTTQTLTVSALTATGRVLWTLSRNGSSTTSSAGVLEESDTEVAGVVHRGLRDDVLITTTNAVLPRAATVDAGGYQLKVESVDVANGAVSMLSTTTSSAAARPQVQAVPDLGHDGVDDYLVSYTSPSLAAVEAHDGTTGTTLWQHQVSDPTTLTVLTARNPVTLVVLQPAADLNGPGTVELIDVVTGIARWKRAADDAAILSTSTVATLNGSLVNVIDPRGHSVWSRKVAEAESTHLAQAGDIDADNRRDVLLPGSTSVILSGRSGRQVYSGPATPVLENVDGRRGADLMLGGQRHVDLVSPRGAQLWRASLGAGEWTPLGEPAIRLGSARQALVVTNGTDAAVIQGLSGRVMWTYSGRFDTVHTKVLDHLPARDRSPSPQLPATGLNGLGLSWLCALVLSAALVSTFTARRSRVGDDPAWEPPARPTSTLMLLVCNCSGPSRRGSLILT